MPIFKPYRRAMVTWEERLFLYYLYTTKNKNTGKKVFLHENKKNVDGAADYYDDNFHD